MQLQKISCFGTFLFCIACNPVNTESSVFTKSLTSSLEYKSALATKIESGNDDLTYIFDKYVEEKGKEYLDITAQGKDFVATTQVLISQWGKLEEIKRTKGESYSGAHLDGLQLTTVRDSADLIFIFKDVEGIVD